jgi:subtilisin family serine protease
MQRRVALLAVVLPLLPSLAGCLGGGGGRTEWAYDVTQLDALAQEGRTGRGVTVAFLDTGINARHPSMKHLVDGDRDNGELVAFRDFLGSANTVAEAFDDDGHGTHVAGILAARGGSGLDKLGGIDLEGGAPDVDLVVARVCSQNTCDASVIPAAIDWAVAQGADVVSLSLGGQFGLRDAVTERNIESSVSRAVASGTVVISSAGNGGPGAAPQNQTTDVESPGNIPEVIAVGAVDEHGQVAGFSSRGDDAGHPCRSTPLPLPMGLSGRCPPDQKPELVAPGVGILSAWTKNLYVQADGTSQATPFVTAAVALILQGHPDLPGSGDVARLKQALVSTAQPLAGQQRPHDPAAGYGLVQAAAALQAFNGS